jgi:hypothetical protein
MPPPKHYSFSSLPSDCASHVYTFLAVADVSRLARCCQFALAIAHRPASYSPFDCCRTGDDFDICQYRRWREARSPVRLSFQQLLSASASRFGRVAVRDVCIGILQIRSYKRPSPSPTSDIIAGMLARLTSVRSLRAGLLAQDGRKKDPSDVRSTEYLQAIIRVWGAQLQALETVEFAWQSLAVVALGWDRLTALEYLRIYQEVVLDWTSLAGVRFRPERACSM